MKNIFQKLRANVNLIMACLQIYRELLSLTTFLRIHSNSKEVSYLSRQNAYPDLKITCHIRLKFFLWTKLQENLLLAKNLISATAPLSKITHQKWHNYPFSQRNKTKKAMGVEVGGDGSERGWKIGGLHKIGGLGRSANYGHFRARLGLVGSLKSKRMSNWIAIWKLKLHENENKIWKKTF